MKTLYLINSTTKETIGSVEYDPDNVSEDLAPLVIACGLPTTFTLTYGDTVHTGVQICNEEFDNEH